jgi:hypothetical protein
MVKVSKFVGIIGLALILVTGIIHFIETGEYFEKATYLGVLFVLNGVGGVVSAIGIQRNRALMGWGLGIPVAAGAFAGYIISRTVGMPGLPVDPKWFEPLGIVSLVVEGGFTILAVCVLTFIKRS